MHGRILEQIQIHPIWPGYVVDDGNDDTVATGDYISLKHYGKVLILIVFNDGTATSGDIDIEVYQATDVSGTGVKVLNALTTGRIFTKMHATTLAAEGTWTQITQATADEIYDCDTSGEQLGMIAVEIDASDLDSANNFDCIRADLDTITSAKLLTGLYILGDPKFPSDVDEMLSALAD